MVFDKIYNELQQKNRNMLILFPTEWKRREKLVNFFQSKRNIKFCFAKKVIKTKMKKWYSWMSDHLLHLFSLLIYYFSISIKIPIFFKLKEETFHF
jgi:hypothetical protein